MSKQMALNDSFDFGTPTPAASDGHKDWIIIQSMSSPILRSIPEGDPASGYEPLDFAADDTGATNGDVEPVVDADGNYLLCRENDDEGVCECIPW